MPTVLLYAQIFVQLKKIGRPIAHDDIRIAACAMYYGLALATDDANFQFIFGLALA